MNKMFYHEHMNDDYLVILSQEIGARSLAQAVYKLNASDNDFERLFTDGTNEVWPEIITVEEMTDITNIAF